MNNSIQQFLEEGVKKLDQVFIDYAMHPEKIAEMVSGVTGQMVDLGLSVIAEEWNWMDDTIHKRKDIHRNWYVVRTDEATIGTSLGEVRYHKTYYRNKETGEYCYLLDRVMGIDKHTRLTEDAVARVFSEAVDSSYRKGGENASISAFSISKQAVMDKLHVLKFPKTEADQKKRKVDVLYIDADEDHVSLQYLDKKGDIKDSKSNTYMPKLAYVYEGVKADGDRHELIHQKYFGGGYDGTQGTADLWKEIYDYIEAEYDADRLKKIYVNGDGAEWIKTGAKIHEKARFVLDRFHMHKYILAATSHLMDSAEDVRSELFRAINGKRKQAAADIFNHILDVTGKESKIKAVERSRDYILGQWAAIMNGVKNRKDNIHCSAEGHISHVFADRLSSRPLGWSRVGADKMARLRVYQKNGGDMLKLVRFQKEDLPVAAGAEELRYSAKNMFVQERRAKEALGSLADIPVYSIPYPHIKKIAALKDHIWGL